MIRSLTFFLILSVCFSVYAEEVRPKIGLVLSGGGAKGAAHIGVLKILEQNRIPVDYIAGTSIGAYVAGMYALGYSATEIETIMLNESWSDGYSDTIPRQALSYRNKQQRDRFNLPLNMGYSDDEVKVPNGLLRGQTMSQLLQRSTGLVNQFGHFDELAIPYRAVATDLETSQAVVISNGSIVKAMQASATVPGALQPVEHEGRLLIDGGIANNMPVDVVKALGADIIIAVDIGSALVKKENLTSTIAVLNQLSTMLTNASTDKQKLLLTSEDILIRPDVGEMSTTDFTIMPKAFSLGEQAALKHLVSLQSLSVDKEEFQAYLARKKKLSRRWLEDINHPIVNIVFNNDSKVSDATLRETLDLQEGEVVTQERLAKGIADIYSLDKFERVNAEFIDTDQGRVLTLNAHAKSWGPNYFQLGFSWEDDFTLDSVVSFDFAYTLTDLTDLGGEWRNELRLGFEKLISSELYLPLDYDQDFYARAELGYELKDWNFYENNARALQLSQTLYRGDLGIGYNYVKEGMMEFGFTGESGELENKAFIDAIKYDTFGAYLKFGYDDLNSINFPTEGNRFTFNLFYRNEKVPDLVGNASSENSFQIEADWRGALSVGNHAFVGIASFATVDIDDSFSVHMSELGGFLNLSGYHKNALVGPHKVFGAFVYQYDLGKDVLGMRDYPLYLGGSVEAGNVWTIRSEADLSDLIFSGSLFLGTDTDIGPAALGFGWADDGEKTIFLFIGKNW
ncbi:patatin-like phospholipase family protein [Shewanella eurypsychrophilus]|uniref:Patatin-like phospholipase family protein n=1 Tax=Shewanella eurypsychrophilus TaxID=2593656 RepID=A0ABX6V208_9GAMM|nr:MULTISPECIES: patatin-like phospholipase family protein [Shewanella]QFU21032.1 patatin [Shewanella sp. YLB-09]QPG56321.1 patatin-like phospholipase family protein [Shewanella eurypsychrophilus]